MEKNQNNILHLCKAIEQDLASGKKFLKVLPFFFIGSLVILFLSLHAFGLRHDLHEKLNQWQMVLALTSLAIMFVCCFGVIRFIKTMKSWLLASSFFLLFLAFWEPLCNTMLGVKFAGWGNFFHWSPKELTCMVRGLSIGMTMLVALNFTQYKLKLLPSAQTYFITGTISAVSGMMLQNLMCHAAAISHISVYHLSQAVLIFSLNYGVQKALDYNWKQSIDESYAK